MHANSHCTYLQKQEWNISDAGKYRPVTLATIIFKLFEHYILSCISPLLATTDNQFGFKPKHGTDMCLFLLKQTVFYYVSKDDPVFSAFLDASKAGWSKTASLKSHITVWEKICGPQRGTPLLLVCCFEPFKSRVCHFFAKLCSPITRQPPELESCSNPIRIQKVFMLRSKKVFLFWVRGSLGGTSQVGVFNFCCTPNAIDSRVIFKVSVCFFATQNRNFLLEKRCTTHQQKTNFCFFFWL